MFYFQKFSSIIQEIKIKIINKSEKHLQTLNI
jgi:hypothetical protein